MGVQAGRRARCSTTTPPAAREALVTVETSAREALTELRQLLETLRTPDAETPAIDGAPGFDPRARRPRE
jgi:signal transduction histidine kinase